MLLLTSLIGRLMLSAQTVLQGATCFPTETPCDLTDFARGAPTTLKQRSYHRLLSLAVLASELKAVIEAPNI